MHEEDFVCPTSSHVRSSYIQFEGREKRDPILPGGKGVACLASTRGNDIN